MFEKKEFSQLLETMRGSLQDKSQTKFDFTEGSVVRTLFESFAYEMAVLYEQMERVYFSGYVDSAEDTNLDRVVATLGIKRGEPEYAIFNVTFERDMGIDEDIEIPLNTLVTTEDSEKSPRKAYKTIELKTIAKGESAVQVRVQAEQPDKEAETEANTIIIMPQPIPGVKSVNNQEAVKFIGKDRETDLELRDRAKGTLLAASGANANSIQNALLSISGVNEVKVRENFSPEAEKYGIVEVIVDTADWFKFNEQKNQKQLQDAIDRVRAAGVYVLLKAPEPVYLDGTFQIEVAPELKGSPETREKLEKEAREKITSYIRNFPMGQSLAIAQLTKTILDINGIDNIVDYRLFTQQHDGERQDNSDKKKLEIQELQKLIPRKIKFASEIQQLPVDIQIKVQNLDDSKEKDIKNKLTEYFEQLQPSNPITKDDIKNNITDITVDEIKLIPHFRDDSTSFDGETIEISFIEKAILGKVFIYENIVNINGAIKLKLPGTTKQKEKDDIYAKVRQQITNYLGGLQPE